MRTKTKQPSIDDLDDLDDLDLLRGLQGPRMIFGQHRVRVGRAFRAKKPKPEGT